MKSFLQLKKQTKSCLTVRKMELAQIWFKNLNKLAIITNFFVFLFEKYSLLDSDPGWKMNVDPCGSGSSAHGGGRGGGAMLVPLVAFLPGLSLTCTHCPENWRLSRLKVRCNRIWLVCGREMRNAHVYKNWPLRPLHKGQARFFMRRFSLFWVQCLEKNNGSAFAYRLSGSWGGRGAESPEAVLPVITLN